ncbi:MAG TPA: MarR family transcriptional regulator [Dongiaceae bacterium]|nr:MarR family transcriptional regulator [Dongiaceae bacterium]
MEATEIFHDFIDRTQVIRQKAGRGIHVADTADLARVVRLAAFLMRDLAEICADAGLKTGQFQVLAELRGRDPLPMSASDLARAIILTSGGMTPVLDQLEERGLILRQIDPEDRRARRISITEKGRSAVNRALGQQITHYRAVNSVLSLEERQTLSAILRKLLVAVEPAAD